MNTLIVFQYTKSGTVEFITPQSLLKYLDKSQKIIFETALIHTLDAIKIYSSSLFRCLVNRRIQIRIIDDMTGTACLLPHDIILNTALLTTEKRTSIHRHRLLVGSLERVFYHLCNPELHTTEVRLHSLRFHHANQKILKSTIQELRAHPEFDEPDWLTSLEQSDSLLLLDRFWEALAKTDAVPAIQAAAGGAKSQVRRKIRSIINDFADRNQKALSIKDTKALKLLTTFKWLFLENGDVVIIYKLRDKLLKAVRLCSRYRIDAMASHAACRSIVSENLRVDIFHDHGHWLRGWVQRLQAWAKDSSLPTLEKMLLSDEVLTVKNAIQQLANKIRRKENMQQAKRLLYSALYYWNNPNRGICRSIALEVSAILEDVLTERPFTFPATRINRSVFRPKPAEVRITTQKLKGLRKDKFLARVVWSVNGRRKKPLAMDQAGPRVSGGFITFKAVFPVRHGWIHYSVQTSTDEGKSWKAEELDDHSQGLIKYIADERGQRVLSFYADTLNLKLNQSFEPIRDENGMFVYGTFDEIAEQLEDIRAEGYTRIYPLGALELGWAGEAGPDPSVFSVWDGKTIRRDLGGMEALLQLRKKADGLGMKILLCVLSHFSRANASYPYHMPAYIVNKDEQLTRRAGWDGEWSEWLDSFMINMRDFDNVQALATIGMELAEMGFGLRIDVGHGFDTVFPIDNRCQGNAKLLGEVTTGGFEPVDLRGSEEPNISLLYMSYQIQKAVPKATVIYSEQWHGNETRMIKSGNIPYNSLIKNLENIRSGQAVHDALGLNDNLAYLNKIYRTHGGQTLSLFNSHDEESPTSNYQNMIWPVAAFLVLSSQGPIMYYIGRLPGSEVGTMQQRFDDAYTECWKHWVNNRFTHPWDQENRTRWQILANYPILYGFGKYLRGLYQLVDENPALARGVIVPIHTQNDRIAAFLRIHKNRMFLCLFNFPNSHLTGQQAVLRRFNFLIGGESVNLPNDEIRPSRIYEVIERYNNAEGRTRRAKKEFWSGEELVHLGFGGLLAPVSSHVYEFVDKTTSFSREQMLMDSFGRYTEYGKRDRVRYSYVTQAFLETIDLGREDFDAFANTFELLTNWIEKKRGSGLSCLMRILAEISEDHLIRRHQIINFLMRIAVNEKKRFDTTVCRSAADILHGMNLGTIALVSPESSYSGAAGGVGIYTTDIADVLSELGFHVVVVTPLYEMHREKIIKNFAPRYDGYNFSIQFPEFDDSSQSIRRNTTPDVVNILRSSLLRFKHGKSARVEVLYLENAKYLDTPYGGQTGEDKIRRARILSQGALEALRSYNYYPTIIQTNEWPSWLLPAYLKRWAEYSTDPHFFNTRVGSMLHNPHPSYSIVMDEANMFKRYYYCMILGMDAMANTDICINPDSYSGHEIDLTHLMLKTSDYIGTVSKAMRRRMLDEPEVFRHGHLYHQLYAEERFFSRRNGFNMAARQRFWFRSKKSILESYDTAARKRLFSKYTRAKKLAKRGLQSDPNIQLFTDDESKQHVIFSMLHRVCKQKGFELLVDWKVYEDNHGGRWVTYEPWKMMGTTVLEYFLSQDERIQYVIAGRVEDSFDGRRYDMHLRRIASLGEFHGRFAYYPEGSLSPSLYRNLYVGSQFFVMPSGGEVGEPCGISQQEAHAGGTPVIAHHQDGLQRTVSDRDFGDREFPSNGIKFSGFSGEALLDALLDAVNIYYHNRRLNYFDKKGHPKKLRYRDLSRNAFTTDHRWLRLLHEYIQTYSIMAGVELPEYIHAIRLVVGLADAPDGELSSIILQKGLTVPEAVNCLLDAVNCPILSVRKAVEGVLIRLYDVLRNDISVHMEKRLLLASTEEPEKKRINRLLEQMTRRKQKSPAK